MISTDPFRSTFRFLAPFLVFLVFLASLVTPTGKDRTTSSSFCPH